MINKCLNYIFLGGTRFSEEILNFLIGCGYLPKAVFYIPQEFKISWSETLVKNVNYADLRSIAVKHEISCYEVNSIPGKRLMDYEYIIKELELDLILVLGFYYWIPKKFRELARHGAWGIHASLLPKYAGGAPLVWAIINGEKETGVTLFKLEDGVDDGDIISQESFKIELSDTIKEVYEKATELSKKLLINALSNISEINLRKQDKEKIKIWPQRKESDGILNWNQNSIQVYNFIRAQTKPYPCAFSFIKGKKVRFIQAELTQISSKDRIPGEIVSFCGQLLVATKDNYIKILRIADEYGNECEFKHFVESAGLIAEVFR